MRHRRWALALLLTLASACTDIRDFRGTWVGDRVGDAEVLRVGFELEVGAEFVVDEIDLQTMQARFTTSDGLFADAAVTPLAAAEADVLATLSFDGSPARVFFSFAETTDGGGPATVLVALYDDDRIEIRAIRGGVSPIYGVFALAR